MQLAKYTIGAKIFGAFAAMSAIIGLMGLAGYGVLSAAGTIAVTTFDGPLMAINYARAASDYHRDGPGYILGFGYASYMHISVGWYGKEWGGDHAANAMNLRTYALLQIKDNPNQKERITSDSQGQTPKGGCIGWGNWKFDAWMQENNTPYWVDQVWQHYRWSGDKQFLKEMWPHLLRAVEWETTYNDPDGDGLFRSHYDYWNSDSGGKGPKGVAPTATGFAMLMAATQVANELGEVEVGKHYLQLAGKSRTALERESRADGQHR